jgi:predicted ATP-grasp superfamily ATP-dependent carboligase
MYTGALENRPGLVEQMARKRPLWGNSSEALRHVRDPFWISLVLAKAELPCPKAASVESHPKEDTYWIVKPIHGAAGRGIRPWDGRHATHDGAVYLQEFITGLACAAVFVAEDKEARLLGVTEQLTGETWLHASPFVYCGSIGPLFLPTICRTTLEDIGATLATQAGLQGLFGIDFVLRDNIPWIVEVNPRYTASVEIVEYATGTKALAWHKQAFAKSATAKITWPLSWDNQICGKAVLFAKEDLRFPAEGPWLSALRSAHQGLEMPSFADIPAAGEPIGKGRPIFTLFAQAESRDSCYQQFQESAQDLDRWLFGR